MMPIRSMSTAPTKVAPKGSAPAPFQSSQSSRCRSKSSPRCRMPVSSTVLPSTFTPLPLTDTTM